MARGFWHPDLPYWETDDDLPPEFRNAYPAGTQEVPLRPSPDHVWNGTEWLHQPQPEPVPDASPLQLYGELDQVHGIDLEAEIGGLSQKALRRFRLANSISRHDPAVAGGLQPRLGWTDAQVDNLFRAAAARQA